MGHVSGAGNLEAAPKGGAGRRKLLTVPVGDVLVGDTRGDIEHDDTALAVDVVTITETTKLLLTCGVPNIELDLAEVLSQALAVGAFHPSTEGENRTVVKPRG